MQRELDVQDLIGFGLHGDGVPCNYDRTESVTVISLNLPGVPGKHQSMRIPLVALPSHVITSERCDDIMEVFAWSMRHLLVGANPACRHDGSPWLKGKDGKRSKAPEKLPFHACLAEVRSDWDFLAKCFHFATHNLAVGICWLCPRSSAKYVIFTRQ